MSRGHTMLLQQPVRLLQQHARKKLGVGVKSGSHDVATSAYVPKIVKLTWTDVINYVPSPEIGAFLSNQKGVPGPFMAR